MSASETDLHEIVAQSAESDPVEALRDALGDILAGLIAAGCGPHHLREMIWETDRPEAFHLSRHTVELAYRETFAGFRPPIRLQPRSEPGLTIRARHAAAQPLPDTLVDGYSLRDLGRQYSPRLQADMKALFRQWSRDGEAFRAQHGAADLAYGAGRFERLDLYRPAGAKRARRSSSSSMAATGRPRTRSSMPSSRKDCSTPAMPSPCRITGWHRISRWKPASPRVSQP